MPVGWKDGAVAFKVVALPFVWPLSAVAIGAMFAVYVYCWGICQVTNVVSY